MPSGGTRSYRDGRWVALLMHGMKSMRSQRERQRLRTPGPVTVSGATMTGATMTGAAITRATMTGTIVSRWWVEVSRAILPGRNGYPGDGTPFEHGMHGGVADDGLRLRRRGHDSANTHGEQCCD